MESRPLVIRHVAKPLDNLLGNWESRRDPGAVVHGWGGGGARGPGSRGLFESIQCPNCRRLTGLRLLQEGTPFCSHSYGACERQFRHRYSITDPERVAVLELEIELAREELADVSLDEAKEWDHEVQLRRKEAAQRERDMLEHRHEMRDISGLTPEEKAEIRARRQAEDPTAL